MQASARLASPAASKGNRPATDDTLGGDTRESRPLPLLQFRMNFGPDGGLGADWGMTTFSNSWFYSLRLIKFYTDHTTLCIRGQATPV